MLEGVVVLSPAAVLLSDENVMIQSWFSGLEVIGRWRCFPAAGSGHEPAHAGYVGRGMLYCAGCRREVFTSPSTDAVLAGIRASAGAAGALIIVKNYTGDRLNFGLAAELARAEGIPVEIVAVADDVALKDSVQSIAGAGLPGMVLVRQVGWRCGRAGGLSRR